ncbi:uncharacterized protein BO95DRAFT_430434 [Aspergillus brunneoviolaceus CBS 621.78]|uniref:Uncharacterized protein n=1 Tax=Aspergillus brunneoviolaceus CBS 621.78 TaxID=1450534 RepID=A0ACD1GDW5_9EURO|nr:hypothetical protein BO95DRAFT_430434 [Aspergillus brunneoviolaceus CBS 621.78]RAH47468.1 hypothetical protein BO95DRAFT_430434 [Aspergillus brunneoviolaceus CBS 621.78]
MPGMDKPVAFGSHGTGNIFDQSISLISRETRIRSKRSASIAKGWREWACLSKKCSSWMIEAERLGKAGAAEKVEVARQLMKAGKLCQAVELHIQAQCKEQGASKGGDIGDGLAVMAASYLEALEEDCQDSDKLMEALTHLFGQISRGGESCSYEKSRRKVLNIMMRKIDIVVNQSTDHARDVAARVSRYLIINEATFFHHPEWLFVLTKLL